MKRKFCVFHLVFQKFFFRWKFYVFCNFQFEFVYCSGIFARSAKSFSWFFPSICLGMPLTFRKLLVFRSGLKPLSSFHLFELYSAECVPQFSYFLSRKVSLQNFSQNALQTNSTMRKFHQNPFVNEKIKTQEFPQKSTRKYFKINLIMSRLYFNLNWDNNSNNSRENLPTKFMMMIIIIV